MTGAAAVAVSPPALRHWGMILLIGALWGANFPAISVALEGFRPLTLAAAAGPGLRGPVVAVGAFTIAVPYALLSWGQQHVAAGFAGVAMAAVPLMVAPMAHLLVPGERMTAARLGGVLLGFVGVVVLIGPGALAAGGAALEGLGRLAVIGAAAGFALGAILTRLCPPVDFLTLGAASVTAAAAVLVPVALVVEGVPVWPEALRPVLALLFLGVVTTGGALLLRIRVTREVGPGFMVLTNYQVPLWAVLLSVLFLGETVPAQLALALGLILVGLTLAGRPDRLLAAYLRRRGGG